MQYCAHYGFFALHGEKDFDNGDERQLQEQLCMQALGITDAFELVEEQHA
jgi:hypothetical protein